MPLDPQIYAKLYNDPNFARANPTRKQQAQVVAALDPVFGAKSEAEQLWEVEQVFAGPRFDLAARDADKKASPNSPGVVRRFLSGAGLPTNVQETAAMLKGLGDLMPHNPAAWQDSVGQLQQGNLRGAFESTPMSKLALTAGGAVGALGSAIGTRIDKSQAAAQDYMSGDISGGVRNSLGAFPVAGAPQFSEGDIAGGAGALSMSVADLALGNVGGKGVRAGLDAPAPNTRLDPNNLGKYVNVTTDVPARSAWAGIKLPFFPRLSIGGRGAGTKTKKVWAANTPEFVPEAPTTPFVGASADIPPSSGGPSGPPPLHTPEDAAFAVSLADVRRRAGVRPQGPPDGPLDAAYGDARPQPSVFRNPKDPGPLDDSAWPQVEIGGPPEPDSGLVEWTSKGQGVALLERQMEQAAAQKAAQKAAKEAAKKAKGGSPADLLKDVKSLTPEEFGALIGQLSKKVSDKPKNWLEGMQDEAAKKKISDVDPTAGPEFPEPPPIVSSSWKDGEWYPSVAENSVLHAPQPWTYTKAEMDAVDPNNVFKTRWDERAAEHLAHKEWMAKHYEKMKVADRVNKHYEEHLVDPEHTSISEPELAAKYREMTRNRPKGWIPLVIDNTKGKQVAGGPLRPEESALIQDAVRRFAEKHPHASRLISRVKVHGIDEFGLNQLFEDLPIGFYRYPDSHHPGGVINIYLTKLRSYVSRHGLVAADDVIAHEFTHAAQNFLRTKGGEIARETPAYRRSFRALGGFRPNVIATKERNFPLTAKEKKTGTLESWHFVSAEDAKRGYPGGPDLPRYRQLGAPNEVAKQFGIGSRLPPNLARTMREHNIATVGEAWDLLAKEKLKPTLFSPEQVQLFDDALRGRRK